MSQRATEHLGTTEKGGAMEWPQRSVVSLCLLLLAACGGESSSSDTSKPSPVASDLEVPSWSLPADPLSLAREAGLMPDSKEYLTYHVHAHLDVFVNGDPVEIPAGIGIEITDPAVKNFGSGYGGIPEQGCEQVCISPLHTHDPDGVIHTEAPSEARFTLGQFFVQMGIRLDASCVDEFCTPDVPVAVVVDGQRQSGNPADIVLRDNQEIAIVIGTPPEEIPDTFSGG
jgi:hypothetical protein